MSIDRSPAKRPSLGGGSGTGTRDGEARRGKATSDLIASASRVVAMSACPTRAWAKQLSAPPFGWMSHMKGGEIGCGTQYAADPEQVDREAPRRHYTPIACTLQGWQPQAFWTTSQAMRIVRLYHSKYSHVAIASIRTILLSNKSKVCTCASREITSPEQTREDI